MNHCRRLGNSRLSISVRVGNIERTGARSRRADTNATVAAVSHVLVLRLTAVIAVFTAHCSAARRGVVVFSSFGSLHNGDPRNFADATIG